MRSWMIGMVLGILPVALFVQLPHWPLLLLPAISLAGLVRRDWPSRLVGGLSLGLFIAIVHGHMLLHRRLASDCVLQPLSISGQVSSLPRVSQMPDGTLRQRFEFDLKTLQPARCDGPGRLLLSYYGPQRLMPGQHWRFEVKLKKPWGLANPGSFNMQAWFVLSGIDALGSVASRSALLLDEPLSWRTGHHRLRQRISERLAGLSLPPDVLAVLRAITVADRSGIDQSLWQLLQRFGVNHLLVISGLHIGLVAGGGYLLGGLLLRLLLLRGHYILWLPGALALLFASVYAALAGFSVATVRALCMLACFTVAGLIGRTSASSNNLLLAGVIVLCLNPLAGLGSGLWLSFGAVAALLWLACWQGGWRLPARLVGTHVFMALVMLPMGSWWFGGSSMVAAFSNFAMIPLVGLWVVPAALLAAVAFCLGSPLDIDLWHIAAWPLQQVLPIATDLASSHHSWFYLHFSPAPIEALLAGCGVALIAIPASRSLSALAILMLIPLLLPAVSPVKPATLQTRVTVLDVGQGTAVVIRSGAKTLLYDTGGGDPAGANMATSVVLPYLRSQGIAALDTLVVSHADLDHSAGAADVLRTMPVSRFLYGARLPGLPGGEPCIAGRAWQWPGGQRFQFLSPAVEDGLSRNDRSCVLLVEVGDYRLLLPGDIERGRELDLVRYWRRGLKSDWLLLAHHGSATSSTPALIKTVRPATLVVSSGYANRFGHPHQDVLARLHAAGLDVLGTAEGGALEFHLEPGREPVASAYRWQYRRFWM